MILRLNAPKGQQVKFLDQNGYDHQRKTAAKYLSTEQVYHVDEILIYDWSSDVRLKEFPEQLFNTVMFEETGEILPELEDTSDIYERQYRIRHNLV